jgi:hypothetical protein
VLENMPRRHRLALMGLLLVSACGGEDRPLEVTAIQVGRSRNADRTVAQPTFEFRPDETIYVSIVTEGAGDDAVVKVRWRFGSGTVGESQQTISPRDRAVTPFEMRSAAGFPIGEYTLEVFLNDTPVGTRDLRVRP